MGNIIGCITWDKDTNNYDYCIKKLDDLRIKHGLSEAESHSMPYSPDKNKYGVEIAGLYILYNGHTNSVNKIKSFLYDANKIFVDHNIKCQTHFEFLPM